VEKREGGTVESSVVAGDVRAVLRGIKRRTVMRLLSCFVGGVCFGLPRRGLGRRYLSRHRVLRDVEPSEAWSCETWRRETWWFAWVGVAWWW
jgi:hypothetical protein